MSPKFYIDAAGIPHALPEKNFKDLVQNIQSRIQNPTARNYDFGSSVERQIKTGRNHNINQINQYDKQLPSPYNIRANLHAKTSKSPYVPGPGQGLPYKSPYGIRLVRNPIETVKETYKKFTKTNPVQQQVKADAKTGARAMRKIGEQTPKAAMPVKMRPTISGIAGKSLPVVLTAAETVSDIREGQNPYIAAGRNIAGALTGGMTAVGAGLLATEPTIEGGFSTKMAAYAQGREMGRNAFDNLLERFGVKAEPVKRETAQETSNLTKLEDGSTRTGGGDVYSPDGKRYTTSGGVTYDLATGRAINPATNKISEGGYSIDPDSGKRTDSRVNANGILQTGRNFDTMSDDIFRTMLTRNEKLGASEETLAAMRGMRDGTSSLFSSINLPQAKSLNSFENPQIAVATGAIQPKGVNPGFSTKDAVQFKQPDSNMPSVATTPGVKMPVEYTNYMRSADPALSSMDAMRMNERQKGLIYASGQYWAEGADGKAVKVDRDLAKKVKRGAEGADELLANFLGRGGLSAAASSPVEPGTNYKVNDYDSQGNLLNSRNLLTFKDGSTRYLSDIPEDEDLSATY